MERKLIFSYLELQYSLANASSAKGVQLYKEHGWYSRHHKLAPLVQGSWVKIQEPHQFNKRGLIAKEVLATKLFCWNDIKNLGES